MKELLTPPAQFQRAGKRRQYRRANFGVMTSDEIMTQCQKVAEEKEEAEAAKIDRKIDREEKKRQRDFIMNIKKEKDEEKKAKKRKKDQETREPEIPSADNEQQQIVKAKRGRPKKNK